MPVLFGKDNCVDKSFYADALSNDGRIVIEVEAGRATENNQFKSNKTAIKRHFIDWLLNATTVGRFHLEFIMQANG